MHSVEMKKIILSLLFLPAIAFAINFWLGLITSGVMLVSIAIILQIHKLDRIFLGFLSLILIGYAFGGKGFAYLGIYPVFVGEVALSLGVISIIAYFLVGKTRFAPPPLGMPLSFLIGLGILRLIYDLPHYGIFALRDGVIWGYSLFAIVSFWALNNRMSIIEVPVWFAKWIPYFLLLTPIVFLVFRLKYQILPRWPWGPEGGVPILNPKGGDIAVHLSGIMAFLIVGLYQEKRQTLSIRNWIMWTLWLICFVMIGTTGRAAFLTVSFSLLMIGLFRSFRQWLKVIFVMGIVLIGMEAFDISFDVGIPRKISTEQIIDNIRSVFGETQSSNLEGSKRWRLRWWKTIISYTFYGNYFWTGKGFGINLADDDGFQVAADHSLRSPHNSHLTFLARMGVPGFFLWVILQLGFAGKLFYFYKKAKQKRMDVLANLNLWILIYWAAFMINGAFDVFLEGPQGGIWFWSVFGYGLALINYQNRLYRSNRVIKSNLALQNQIA
ncbi:MAG: O-antigen ligase domain-containing protein [Calditrichaeota bacterium]|nr:MAG: O-antigen ligase domain-containing protein [Calditrichota bacterium]